MNEYLLHFFRYTDWAFRKTLEVVLQLPEPQEPVRLLSHLIACQDKWYNRYTQEQPDSAFSWSPSAYPAEELLPRWETSVQRWLQLLQSVPPETLAQDVVFTRPADGTPMHVRLQDVVFQLNCHALHHRGQLATLIRAQGFAPPAADYIFAALREG